MRIVTDGKAAYDKAVLALGMFDGVHIGHRVLLERSRVLAKRSGVPLVACTFTAHPLALIAPDRCPPQLTTFEERAALLEALGVDLLYAQPFTEEMRQMPPEVYVGELIRRFHPVDVVCGYNHTFGRNGAGTSAFLAALGDALGFRTEVVPQVTLNGADVSSSVIRSALGAGDVTRAAQLLGRPYRLSGCITSTGTGNIMFVSGNESKQQLAQGEYRCLLECAEEQLTLPCVVKLGNGNLWRIRIAKALQEGTAQLLFLKKV